MSIDKGSPQYEEQLSAARGCFTGLVIGIIFWVIIISTVYFAR